MDDLSRIEADLEAKRRVESQTLAERAEELRIEEAASWGNFLKLAERLVAFEKSVSTRVPMSMVPSKNDPFVVVCIGSASPLLAKPAHRVSISAGPSDSSFSIRSTDEGNFSLWGLTLDGVIDNLSKLVAELIENPRAYRFPSWVTQTYEFGAKIVSTVVFFGTWIAVGSTGGLWGVLLGWLPASLAALVLGGLWPLAALILAITLMQ